MEAVLDSSGAFPHQYDAFSSPAAVTHSVFWLGASNAVKWTNQMRRLQRFGGESGSQLLAVIVFED